MLVTAGPTHEAIDEVRYIANRSSGRMGIAIAEAARDAGWDVTLLLGPVEAQPPRGVRVERFVSTADLEKLLGTHFPECDVLVMAAAVADYRSVAAQPAKLSRAAGKLTLELTPTPDLVGACAARRQSGQRIVGFALEDAAVLEARAAEKLRNKRLDAIVANPLGTMGSMATSPIVLTPDGRRLDPGGGKPMEKRDFARWLVRWIEEEVGKRPGAARKS